MRLALLTDTYLPDVNGVTTVLATMRAGLTPRGVTTTVIAPAPRSDGVDEQTVLRRASMPCPGYPAVRLSLPLGFDVFRRLDAFAPDAIHVVTEGPIGAIGRRYARRRGLPLVSSYHTDFPRYAARYLGPWAERPVRGYLRRFHAASALIQTPSERSRAELLAMGLSQTVVWGRGVDASHFHPVRRSRTRRAELLRGARLLVLHVGRLAEEKDPATLIEAYTRARAALGNDAAFCVAGDGPRAGMVRTALPWVHHLGFLDRDRLADLYADADLFVFPSATETCGLVALEAMASGLPVLAAEAGGVRENVREGLTGRLLPPGDAMAFAGAIVQLAKDNGQRHAMAAAARAFAVARDWTRELDRLPALYGGLLTGGRPELAPTREPSTVQPIGG